MRPFDTQKPCTKVKVSKPCYWQWRTQGGWSGGHAPPKPESEGGACTQGAKIIWPPPSEVYKIFFFKYTYYITIYCIIDY